jgi:mRNA interferase YafQ
MLEVMYKIGYTARFKKDFKRCVKRGLDMSLLETAIEFLSTKGSLPKIYKTHKLTGKYSDCLECHLQPDWLLIWQQNDNELVLLFMNTGTHSDLF